LLILLKVNRSKEKFLNLVLVVLVIELGASDLRNRQSTSAFFHLSYFSNRILCFCPGQPGIEIILPSLLTQLIFIIEIILLSLLSLVASLGGCRRQVVEESWVFSFMWLY
jgi:hypothetical protein